MLHLFRTVYGMKIPTGFGLIGKTTLEEYEEFLARRRNTGMAANSAAVANGKITRRAYARVGVRGRLKGASRYEVCIGGGRGSWKSGRCKGGCLYFIEEIRSKCRQGGRG